MKLNNAVDTIKKEFSGGHPKFIDLQLEKIKLHAAKNTDYARGGSPIGNFTRVAKIFELYPNLKLSDERVVAVTYLMKQLDSLLWMLNGNYEGVVEPIHGRTLDISIYTDLIDLLNEEMKNEPVSTI